jgi:hypothetical protein
MKFIRTILFIQAIWYLITAIWPLVSIKSFMKITGPKTDIWLVKTVAVLVLAMAITFFSGLLLRANFGPVLVLAIAACVGFAVVEIYYSSQKIISVVYLADGCFEALLGCLYIAGIFLMIRKGEQTGFSLRDDFFK